MNFIQEHLAGYGMSEQMVVYLSNIIMVLCIALLSIVANLVAKKIVLKIIIHIIHNNRYTWDNIFWRKSISQAVASRSGLYHLLRGAYFSAVSVFHCKVRLSLYDYCNDHGV